MTTDLEAAWSDLHDAKPPGWFVGRPFYNERLHEWEQYAFDPAENAKVGVRPRESAPLTILASWHIFLALVPTPPVTAAACGCQPPWWESGSVQMRKSLRASPAVAKDVPASPSENDSDAMRRLHAAVPKGWVIDARGPIQYRYGVVQWEVEACDSSGRCGRGYGSSLAEAADQCRQALGTAAHG